MCTHTPIRECAYTYTHIQSLCVPHFTDQKRCLHSSPYVCAWVCACVYISPCVCVCVCVHVWSGWTQWKWHFYTDYLTFFFGSRYFFLVDCTFFFFGSGGGAAKRREDTHTNIICVYVPQYYFTFFFFCCSGWAQQRGDTHTGTTSEWRYHDHVWWIAAVCIQNTLTQILSPTPYTLHPTLYLFRSGDIMSMSSESWRYVNPNPNLNSKPYR